MGEYSKTDQRDSVGIHTLIPCGEDLFANDTAFRAGHLLFSGRKIAKGYSCQELPVSGKIHNSQ